MSSTTALPEAETIEREQKVPLFHVVLLDDDEHTYDYVIEMLQKLFVFSRDNAFRHAVEVDTFGRTVLMTCELEDNYQQLQLGSYGSGILVDAIIVQRYVEVQCALHTLISVIKVRGARHSRDFRTFDITDQGIEIGAGPAPYDGVLRGSVRMLEPVER